MSKLEWRRLRLNTLSVFSLKITMVWKLYIQIIAKIRSGEKKKISMERLVLKIQYLFSVK